MGKYSIRVTKNAQKDLDKLYKSGNKIDISRVERIFEELAETPTFGIGSPEQLKGNLAQVLSWLLSPKLSLIRL